MSGRIGERLQLLHRPGHRPGDEAHPEPPAGDRRASDREALVFAWVAGVASMPVLGFFTNWLAAVLSAAAILFYVVVYTLS